jgi:hypothetical protein
MTSLLRRGALLAFAAAAMSVPAKPALAQNQEQFYFSDDAALTAGAVVAYPDDPGSLWYDPAGLGGIHRSRVSLSASVIGVRLRTVPGALATEVDGQRRALDLSATNLISTPHAFTLLISPNDDFTLGFGVYVTTKDVLSAAANDLAAPLPSRAGETLDARADVLANVTKTTFGPGIGFPIAPGVRLGFALYGSFFEAITQTDAATRVGPGTASDLVASSIDRIGSSAWGLAATGGLQWDASSKVHLGLLLRSPELVLAGSGSRVTTLTSTVASAPLTTTTAIDESGAPSWLAAPHVVVGTMFEPARGLRLSAEVDLATGISNDALFIRRDAVVDGRLGVEWKALDELILGAGVFTDLATDHALGDTLAASRVDYFGGTLGASILTPIAVLDRDGKEPLILTTTISLRYSVGVGDGRTFASDGRALDAGSTSVVFHDFMPYTGSGVLF